MSQTFCKTMKNRPLITRNDLQKMSYAKHCGKIPFAVTALSSRTPPFN
jgi:hypothetical protein